MTFNNEKYQCSHMYYIYKVIKCLLSKTQEKFINKKILNNSF